MNLQPIFDIAEICHLKGIKNAIISPGSRNAPLTLAFARHPHIQCYSITDERSAAFVGLGMSLKSKEPTVLICTSGSAALNYAPAVAEAFFAQVPLLILTADRPPEWIGQLDGQTVYQENIFGKHTKKSFNFPSSFDYPDSTWHCHRLVNEAINATTEYPQAPVHINLPFRAPFYPESGQKIYYSSAIKNINDQLVTEFISIDYSRIEQYKKILIIAGQNSLDTELNDILFSISKQLNIPIITDIISNGHDIEESIKHQDVFLKNKEIHAELKPEFIINFGLSVISKNLKTFLRKNKPNAQWHIQKSGAVADTFQCLTEIIRTDPLHYFKALEKEVSKPKANNYYSHWKSINDTCKEHLQTSLSQQTDFNEFSAYHKVISALPKSTDLHLANSMAVRYANMIGIYKEGIEVYCNRGTSGIDGSNSTALGAALSTDRQTILLTGDVAFFYDRNAFWHNHIPNNLKIIVFNNHGGGIFRMIDGPRNKPELKTYFETNQKLSAKNLAKEFGFEYFKADGYDSLEQSLLDFYASERCIILELFSDSEVNQRVYTEVLKEN